MLGLTLGSLSLALATLVQAQGISILSQSCDPENCAVDDAKSVKMIVTTDSTWKFCLFTTPDNITLEPLTCDFTDPPNTCFKNFNLPEARPTLWRYKYASKNPVQDCGIELTRVTIADTGDWMVKLCADSEGTICAEDKIRLTVQGNEIQADSIWSFGESVDPGTDVYVVYRTRLPHDSCRFVSPDNYTFHVQNGRPNLNNKHPDDTARPDTWQYQWFGWNDTNRDCGIRLRSLHPADEGSWTVRIGNQGEPSQDMMAHFTIHATDFELQIEPTEATGDEGTVLLARYRVTYPYQSCVFTTPDGQLLEAVRCKPAEDIDSCITRYNATWEDPLRQPGYWTYQYQYWNDSNLDCGIQINNPVILDTGNWTFSVVSVAGEEIHQNLHINIISNTLVAEDMDPEVELGKEATMVFRTRLPYDTCTFHTPQGNIIEMVAGLPTVYNKSWEDNGERPNGEWTYSWHAWNSTTRDCGIKIHRIVSADKGEWTVMIGKRSGTSLTSTFVIDVRDTTTATEGSTTAAGGSTTAAGGSSTAAGGSSTAGEGSSTAAGGSSTAAGGSSTAGEGSSTAAGGSSTAAGGSSTAGEGSSTAAGGSSTAGEGSSTAAGGSSTAAGGSSTSGGGGDSTATPSAASSLCSFCYLWLSLLFVFLTVLY